MEPVIIFVSLFATIFGMLYVFLTTRNRERMAMIEKGADASLFERKKNARTPFSIAKFILNLALLLVGIGAGILSGYLIAEMLGDRNSPIYISSMLLICGGLGLIAGYFITRKIEEKEK